MKCSGINEIQYILCFTIFSLDHHGRSSIEGYGFTDLPKLPGYYNIEVQTWKPKLNNEQKLSEFFLGLYSLKKGGYIKLKDIGLLSLK